MPTAEPECGKNLHFIDNYVRKRLKCSSKRRLQEMKADFPGLNDELKKLKLIKGEPKPTSG